MAEKKGLGLPQTRGIFKLRGIATGMNRKNALKKGTTKTNQNRNVLSIGVTTAPESTVYVSIEGMEKDKAYFGKKSEEEGKKGETIEVPWAKRFEKQPEGFELFGVTVGIEKDEKGSNIVETLTEFDATAKLFKGLEDGESVFVYGEIEYSSYMQKDELRRNKKFIIKNMYKTTDVINFDSDDFEEKNDFKQRMIYMGIEKIQDKNDPRYQVNAKIVTYQTVEDADFIIRDKSLANQFKAHLKPYHAIDIWGNIYNKVDTEEVNDSSSAVWGQEDSFKKTNNNYIRELVINGADPKSIDKDTYSEEIIEKAIGAMKTFGEDVSSSDWGTGGSIDIKDEDLPW
ncbi:hypothetical protein P4V47_16560 [Brevibacillus laterosporus]|uniref:hypothetical protein n=1 Tax=Brevibacillus laterosporus TaxID=1465 RepID=UPI002E232890|nr:hypothetical protein [Brevibacillus laterosporus]